MIERVKSGMIGCGLFLITLGGLGFLSVFFGGSSDRAIWQLFITLGKLAGSVELFSVITIIAGFIMIVIVLIDNEIRRSKSETTENPKDGGRR